MSDLRALTRSLLAWLAHTSIQQTPDGITGLKTVTASVRPGTPPDSIPTAVFPTLLEVFKPDIAAFYIQDTPTTLTATQTFPSQFWERDEIRARFMGRTVKGYAIGRALATREAVHVRASPELVGRGDYDPFTPAIASELIIPLFADDRPVGVVVLSRSEPRRFSDTDITTAHAIGVFLSGLYAHVVERATMAATLAFLRQVSTLSMENTDELLAGALRALTSLVPYAYSSVWLYNQPLSEEPASLALRFLMGLRPPDDEIADKVLDRTVILLDKSLSGRAVTEKRPCIFDDIQNDPAYANPAFAKAHNLEWFVSVPILAGAEVLGVMNIYPAIARQFFDASLLDLMQVLANQLATSLRISFVHRAEASETRYEPILMNLLRAGGQQAQWDQVATLISRELACEACSIFLMKDNGRLGLVGSTGIIGDPFYDDVEYAAGEGLTGECFDSNRPILHYHDLPGPSRGVHLSKFREKIRTHEKSRSVMFVPLAVQGQPPRGVIRCNNKEQSLTRHCGLFTREDGLLLEQISERLSDVKERLDWGRRMDQRHDRQIHDLHHEMLSPINGIYVLIEPLLDTVERLKASGGQLSADDALIRTLESIFEGAVQGSMVAKAIGALDDELLIHRLPFDLVDALMTCKRWLKSATAQKRIDVRVGWVPRRKTNGDREQVQRLLYNLLGNAIKYADPAETSRYVAILATKTLRGLDLVFEDNGIGIPSGEEDDIFIRGVRGTNVAPVAAEGSGLGLAFCRKIATAHGWEITLRRRAKPTVFVVGIEDPVA